MKERQIRTKTRESNERVLFYAIELKLYLYVPVQPQQNQYCIGSAERVTSGIFTIPNLSRLVIRIQRRTRRCQWQLSSIQLLRLYTSSEPHQGPSPTPRDWVIYRPRCNILTLHFFGPLAQPPFKPSWLKVVSWAKAQWDVRCDSRGSSLALN